MTDPTENPTPSQQDDIKSVLQDTLFQQVQTLLNFTRTETLQLQIPETDIHIFAGPRTRIAEFIGREIAEPAASFGASSAGSPAVEGAVAHLTHGFAYAQGLDIKAVLYTDTINDRQVCRDDLWLATTEALKALNAGATPAAVAQPTGDQWMFDLAAEHEARGNGLYGPVTFSATGLPAFVSAVAAHLASQSQAAQPTVKTWQERLEEQFARTAPHDGGQEAAMLDEIADLRTANSHLIQQAQIWHDEATAQRATVLDILRHFGLPENDWEAKRLIVAHLAGTSQAAQQPVQHTDLAQRLRAIAAAVKPNDPALVTPKCLTDAADEIDRYYGGMLAWKQTAEKKDRDWNTERMGRVNDRIAAGTSQATKAQAEPVAVPRATLEMIYEAMDHMGDILNEMDACDEEGEDKTTPAFDALRELLDASYVAAAPQAPVAKDAPNHALTALIDLYSLIAMSGWNVPDESYHFITNAACVIEAELGVAPAPVAKEATKEAESVQAPDRRALLTAAINCGHSIDENKIVLHRDKRKEGNALSQLGDRLNEACSDRAPTTSTVSAPEEPDADRLYRAAPRGIGNDWTPGCMCCGGAKDLYNNVSFFVQSRESGEAIVAMFQHGAFLDWREHEPNWIQVKVGACDAHIENLRRLVDGVRQGPQQEGKACISRSIVEAALRTSTGSAA